MIELTAEKLKTELLKEAETLVCWSSNLKHNLESCIDFEDEDIKVGIHSVLEVLLKKVYSVSYLLNINLGESPMTTKREPNAPNLSLDLKKERFEKLVKENQELLSEISRLEESQTRIRNDIYEMEELNSKLLTDRKQLKKLNRQKLNTQKQYKDEIEKLQEELQTVKAEVDKASSELGTSRGILREKTQRIEKLRLNLGEVVR